MSVDDQGDRAGDPTGDNVPSLTCLEHWAVGPGWKEQSYGTYNDY